VSGSLKILSFNVHGETEHWKKNTQSNTFSGILDFLAKQQPDILCLQEFYSYTKDSTKVLERIAEKIDMKYFYYRNYYDSKNTRKIDAFVIYSKFPILSSGFNQNDNKNTYSIYTDISIGDEIVRVYNVHLESFHFGQEDYTFYSNLTEGESSETPMKEGTKKIIMKLRRAYELRAKQADNLRLSIKSSPYPVLVCGDLNDTPSSYSYQVLTRGLNDSFKKAGNGLFGNTYGGNFPSFRIDYLLFDEKFEAYNYKKYKVYLSDHYPISVFINIYPAK
jgi:endonuclease/exonuclease/phosphatase family metal-dependent hydrolase